MNAADNSPTKRKKLIRIATQETGLTEKAQKTLKLLKSFKERSNSSQTLTEKQSIQIKTFGFDKVIAESGGFEYNVKLMTEQLQQAMKTTTEHQNDNETSFESEGMVPIVNETEMNGPGQPSADAADAAPFLEIQKMHLSQRAPLPQAQIAKLRKDVASQEDNVRIQSAVTLQARYDADEESFVRDEDEEIIRMANYD